MMMRRQVKERRDRDRNQNGRGPAKRMKRVNQHRVRRRLQDSEVTLAAARSQYIY